MNQYTATASLRASGVLSGSFSLDAELGARLKAAGEASEVASVSVVLTDVRVEEIADDVVYDLLAKRSPSCRTALSDRRSSGDEVSIVKAVLVADVEIEVAFGSVTSAQVKDRITDSLTSAFGGSVRSDGTHSIVGTSLIWGIRDDVDLANAGAKLPPTGSAERARAIPATAIIDGGAIEPDSAMLVGYEVVPVRQPSRMSCWAAAFTMLLQWRRNATLSIHDAVGAISSDAFRWLHILESDAGLSHGAERDLAKDAGLVTERAAAYTVGGWTGLLKKFGPLWISVGDGITSHAVILTGARGDGSFEGTFFRVIDPRSATESWRQASKFALEFEREAARAPGDGADSLRPQVLHWPHVR